MLRTLLILGRVSNLSTVWTNCLAGWVLVGYLLDSAALFAMNGRDFGFLLAGVSLLYVGGMALNDACDAKWDREHAPDRPIPAGALSAGVVWAIAIVWLAAAIQVRSGSACQFSPCNARKPATA